MTSTYVKEHHSVLLECIATGHPEPNLRWLKNSIHYSQLPNTASTFGKIKIINATLNEAGVYTCEASNEGGSDEKSYNLTVYMPPSIDVSSHGLHKVALLNEEIHLHCPTEGNPLPRVIWYKDSLILMQGQRISFSDDGMTLKISHSTASDAGKYACMAVNEAGTSEAEQFVKVHIPPNINSVEMQGLLEPVINQSVRIHCEAEGLPSPTITWYKNVEQLHLDEKKYRFSGAGRFIDVLNAQEFDSGKYVCHAENVAGQTQKEISIFVSVPPGLESVKHKHHQVVLGKPVRLECDVSGTPPPTISWLKNNMPFTTKDHINFINNNYAIVFSYTLETDAAAYTCIASNNVGSVEQKFNITILVPPSFVDKKSEELSVALGTPVKMECSSAGHPEPDVVWSYNNVSIASDESIIIENEVLTIAGADLNHAGAYSCEASNLAGKVTKTYNLNVNVPPDIKDRNDSTFISAIKDYPASIQCIASGTPRPQIMWLKEDVPLFPDYSQNIHVNIPGTELTIRHLKSSDSGLYTCLAANSAGNATKKIVLNVLEPPSIKSISNQMKPLVGTEVALDCAADGTPVPDIFWLKDNLPVSSLLKRLKVLGKSSLLLKNLDIQDSGNYTCLASNEAGSTSSSLMVEVISPPIIKNKENSQKVLSGKSASLFCETHGYPAPTVMWHKESEIIQSDQNYQIFPDGTLHIKNTSEDDGGTYKCFAKNEAGSMEVARKLDILIPPKIKGDFMREYNVTQTHAVVLHCAAKGFPFPTMAWERNGASLDLGIPRYRIFPSGDLHISLTQSSDTGTYSCIAKNEAGSDKQNADLVVLVPPTVYLDKPKDIVAIKGTTVEVTCSAKGFPAPQISWHKTGNFITETDFNEKLIIENIQPDDGGNYVCVAVNKAGRSHQGISIQVHIPPVFKILPKSQDTSVGDSVTLICDTDGYPIPTITWLMNNTQVNGQTHSSLGFSKLTVENVGKEDQGTYICLAQNAAGERKAAATVYVKTPPEILHSSDIKKVMLEEAVMLDCEVKGDPEPNIIWLKNGIQVEFNQRVIQMQNGSLLIYNSSNQDSGQYKCIASNSFGSAETVAELIIRSKPEFVIQPYNLKTELGNNIYFHCKVIGEPRPTVVWTRNDVLVQNDERFLIFPNNTLKILAVQSSDEAIYSCIANNSFGSAAAESLLIIQVHGKWSQWQEWSHCSASCGQGYQQRNRFCNDPSPRMGGKACIGVSTEAQQCNETPCPVKGDWGNWMEWGDCSATCDVGKRIRHRRCNNPVPANGGENCTGNETEIESCMSKNCPVDGRWSTWSSWEPCSVSCGRGIQVRTRDCNSPSPSYGGSHCYGEGREAISCNISDCEIYGEWSPWSEWSLCSSSCGGGTRERNRECDSPPPSHGGRFCRGASSQKDYCNNDKCPVNGEWGQWSPWGECSASCNKGQKKRFRSCNDPPPSGGGRDCTGPSQEMQVCNAHLCPVDGQWSMWSEWSICSVTCGVGFHSRSRACNNPTEIYGGKECSGDNLELEECGDEACDVAPVQAVGHVIGIINGVEIGLSKMEANISQLGMQQIVMAVIKNITEDTADWMKIIAPLLAPIYWTTAYEIGGAANGYTLTKGFFRRETEVNFISGETLHMTHVARGLDKRGNFLLDIVISGDVPHSPISSEITVHPYYEDYVQTGAGTLYASSTRSYQIGSHVLPYSWNHSIFYDEAEQRMPYLVERLYAKGIESHYDQEKQEMQYVISAAISKGLHEHDCTEGFTVNTNGLYCNDINECEDGNSCSQECNNFPGSFSCHCLQGFTLDIDGISCNDTDECESGIADCMPTDECINTIGSYTCRVICRKGFERSYDDMYCLDVDECATSIHNCSQLCINTIGSYNCRCNSGYHLTALSQCIDIDECNQIESPCSHDCANTPGGFQCSCPFGYELLTNNNCKDINECELAIDTCQNYQECRNTQGGFECYDVCVKGFYRAENGSCRDVDECYAQIAECHISQTCINTPGSYHCLCLTGFYSDGPGKPCKDVNECLQRPSPCSYECHNIPGDYQCLCAPGYKRLPDGKNCVGIEYLDRLKLETQQRHLNLQRNISHQLPFHSNAQTIMQAQLKCLIGFLLKNGICQDIDECKTQGTCQHICENTEGSYRCICPTGYRLDLAKKTCQDIDECSETKISCGSSRMCFNTRGSFDCIDTPCPENYDRDPLTGDCKLECGKAGTTCPPGIKYAEILAFKTVALPSGIQAYQDLVRLIAYDQDGVQLPNTAFSIVENETGIPLRIRIERGRGVLYSERAMESNREHQIKVQAVSYDTDNHVIQYMTKFTVFISVSKYPY